MKPLNIVEAESLVRLYRSIEIESIERWWNYNYWHSQIPSVKDSVAKLTANDMTGFGYPKDCRLCKAVMTCTDCIYKDKAGCQKGEHHETYFAIDEAQSPDELLQAFHHRADHIEKLLEQYQ